MFWGYRSDGTNHVWEKSANNVAYALEGEADTSPNNNCGNMLEEDLITEEEEPSGWEDIPVLPFVILALSLICLLLACCWCISCCIARKREREEKKKKAEQEGGLPRKEVELNSYSANRME